MLKTADRPRNASPKEPEAERKGRKASKETRRLQLIEATIDSLARRGYAETTMADVADGAGLSRGIVNFHFESKDKLLVATLKHMSDEYAVHWRDALDKAGDDPARKLWAVVAADFDRAVCSRRKLAAWCAFWGEAKSRPTYQALCGARDIDYQNRMIELCAALTGEGVDPVRIALGLSAMLEGLWLRLMMGGDDINREKAHEAAVEHLVVLFPAHCTRDGPRSGKPAARRPRAA